MPEKVELKLNAGMIKKILDFISNCYEECHKNNTSVEVVHDKDKEVSKIYFKYRNGATLFSTETFIDWDVEQDDFDSYIEDKQKELLNIFRKISTVAN